MILFVKHNMEEIKTELLQLRYFQKTVECESVTAAAKYYNVPQSSMSQSLKRLETELGVKLFDRINKRLYLNEYGKAFYKNVKQAIELIDDGVKKLEDRSESVSGKVRLLVTENSRFVISCVSEFSHLYPGVAFDICHDYYSDSDSEYDLCIYSEKRYKNMKKSVPLIKESLVLAVCDTHPLAERKAVALPELKNEQFIIMTPRSSLYAVTFENCLRCGFEPNVHISCDDPYFIRKYISEDMGICIAPSVSWAGRFRDNTRLIKIAPPIFQTSYLLVNSERYQSCAVKNFYDFLVEKSREVEGNLVLH